MGSPTSIHQVFINLCTNAAHAMEDKGGILEISLADVTLNSGSTKFFGELNGPYLVISVSDTGTGISTDIIESVFEPYFTTKAPGEGTGMGLALVHGIVKGCGGKITVSSKIGKGTVFNVYLPVTKKHAEKSQYQVVDELPEGSERILLVDDELAITKMTGRILERLGYTVTARTSSLEALELFRSKPNDFDAVITDMTMPNMTGDRLASEMMAIRPEIPVILCTGYSKKISDESAFDIGIKAFAYKPVVKADLAKTVRKVLDDVKN